MLRFSLEPGCNWRSWSGGWIYELELSIFTVKIASNRKNGMVIAELNGSLDKLYSHKKIVRHLKTCNKDKGNTDLMW